MSSSPKVVVARQDVSWIARAWASAGAFMFGPGAPLVPQVPVDPGPATQPVEPFLFRYGAGRNAIPAPRQDEPGLTPYATLRKLARTYDVAAICISHLCTEVAGLEWAIGPAAGADAESTPDQEAKIADLTAWWTMPDRDQEVPWRGWVMALVREELEIAAPFLYRLPTRGGGLHSLQVMQGDLQKIVIDPRGRIRGYQQIWNGMPTAPQGDPPFWTRKQVLYSPRTNWAGSVYGLSFIEQVLTTINAALRTQSYRLSQYTEGNIPSALISAPESFLTQQIQQWQEMFDATVAGQDWAKSRLHMVPVDVSKIHEFAMPTVETTFDLWALQLVCAMAGVAPEEIGITIHAKGANTSGQQAETQQRTGVKPLARWLEDLVTGVIQTDQGAPDLAFRFQMDPPAKVDQLAVAQTDDIYIKNGTISTQYVRADRGFKLAPDDPLLVAPPPLAPTAPEGSGAAEDPLTEEDPALVAGDELLAAKVVQADLRKWREKTIRRVAGGDPLPPFQSEVIPPEVQAAIRWTLTGASDVPLVKAAFAPWLRAA